MSRPQNTSTRLCSATELRGSPVWQALSGHKGLATSCEELTYWKRLWCWDGLRAGGKGDNRGWDGWMASPTRWTWVCVSSGSWWWIGRPGVLRFMGSQRVGHDWVTELNWTDGSMRERFVDIQLQWAVYDFIREHVQTPQKLKLSIVPNILSESLIYKLYGWFVLSYNTYLIKQIWFPLLSLQFRSLFNISHKLSYIQGINIL